jgi:hypothetical protein
MILDFIGQIAETAKGIVDKIVPDQNKKLELQGKIEELRASGELAKLVAETDLAKAQLAINLADAQSEDKYQRRWRPTLAYVCVASVALMVLNYIVHSYLPTVPELAITPIAGLITPILMTLIGARTYEKKTGVA